MKLSVIICEGRNTERYFLPEIAKIHIGFDPLTEKSPFLYKRVGRSTYLLFTDPPKKTPRTGSGKFLSKETYRFAGDLVKSNLYQFPRGFRANEVNYVVLRDTDNLSNAFLTKEKRDIERTFRESGVPGRIAVSFVQSEIESWYIAGLKPNAPFLDKKFITRPDLLLNCKVNSLVNIQEYFWKEVVREEDRETKMGISVEVAKNFDFERARHGSKSFDDFIKKII